MPPHPRGACQGVPQAAYKLLPQGVDTAVLVAAVNCGKMTLQMLVAPKTPAAGDAKREAVIIPESLYMIYGRPFLCLASHSCARRCRLCS